jgi:hypothetical protein
MKKSNLKIKQCKKKITIKAKGDFPSGKGDFRGNFIKYSVEVIRWVCLCWGCGGGSSKEN